MLPVCLLALPSSLFAQQDIPPPPPVKDLSPTAGPAGEKKPLRLVPLSEVINRKSPVENPAPSPTTDNPANNSVAPLTAPKSSGRFIEVQELAPLEADALSESSDTPISEDLVDPNTVAADEHFVPTSLLQITLSGIHKLTGRTEKLTGVIGETLAFGRLNITLHQCRSIMDQGEEGYAALLEVSEHKNTGEEESTEQPTTFRGWLFSTSPSLSSIGHAEYDILLLACGGYST